MAASPEHLDVLIVGAGLSGIGAAHHLMEHHPGKSFAILESRAELGGTWSLFKYPGIRSDSDMSTLGFGFRPWNEPRTLADGPAILDYLRETAAEDGTDAKIRYDHKVLGASWSSDDARWTVDVETGGEAIQLTTSMLLSCSGYYRYDQGYTPEFAGRDRFEGDIIHPQLWPEDFDYTGKRVVVIGSGATAITLVPAMVDRAEHVTMLQRSPTYIASLPAIDPLAKALRKVLPETPTYKIVRWKNVALQMVSYNISRRFPDRMTKFFIGNVAKQLPDGYDVGRHFTPRYNPWDERLCVVPHGNLFKAIRAGKASVVTDHIDTFTEKGILLTSGEELEADVIITATGLNLQLFGGIQLEVDGAPVVMPETMTYKGMMLGGVPNFAFAIGYTNASWTLKADLTGEYISRLMEHMAEHGFDICVPELTDPTVEEEPLLDFRSGYVQRSIATLPKQGSKSPWRLKQSYPFDLATIRFGQVDDGTMQFRTARGAKTSAAPAAANAA
ncbi:MAG: NAD(P)/FAD-dependent oxidoreductase [Solirubrobacteraceae bacterium]|nr:NAD(P)/FAD-dependent oxidoreductase [Patulibacter sp.]